MEIIVAGACLAMLVVFYKLANSLEERRKRQEQSRQLDEKKQRHQSFNQWLNIVGVDAQTEFKKAKG